MNLLSRSIQCGLCTLMLATLLIGVGCNNEPETIVHNLPTDPNTPTGPEVEETPATELEELEDNLRKATVRHRNGLKEAEDKEAYKQKNDPQKYYGGKFLQFYEKYKEDAAPEARQALTNVITRGNDKHKTKAAEVIVKDFPDNSKLLGLVVKSPAVKEEVKNSAVEVYLKNFGDKLESLVTVGAAVKGDARQKTIDKIIDGFADSEDMATAMQGMTRGVPSKFNEDLIRMVAEKSSNEKVKGTAMLVLAKYGNNLKMFKDMIVGDEEAETQAISMMGEDGLAYLKEDREAELAAESEKLLESVVSDFADHDFGRAGTLGDEAEKELFIIRNLSVGKMAPEIEGDDLDGESFKLSDYRGKVVMLDFWGDW